MFTFAEQEAQAVSRNVSVRLDGEPGGLRAVTERLQQALMPQGSAVLWFLHVRVSCCVALCVCCLVVLCVRLCFCGLGCSSEYKLSSASSSQAMR